MKRITMVAHRVKGAERPARIIENFLENEWTHTNESYIVTIERNTATCAYCDADGDKYGCPWHDHDVAPA